MNYDGPRMSAADDEDASLRETSTALAEALGITLPASGDAFADTVSSGERNLSAAHPAPLAAGRVERYRLAEELGRGGMGRVVLAVDEHLGREVAMKELHDAGRGSALVRFVREARVTGQLEHPNIVPVHELAQREDGTFFYTMKRIRGRSLAAALRDARTMDDRIALVRHFRDVCEAVAYAHSRGVVHRDLKPDNVMVGEFGETLVVDWGLAKVRGAADPAADELGAPLDPVAVTSAVQTVAGHAIGTPAYMSPEQARGDLSAIDERSDVWGLGAILFEILTGRPPFVGGSVLALLHAVLVDPAPRVRAIASDAPPELAAIADRALARDPAARYPAAKEVADEIGAWQDGRRVRAYDYSRLERLRRFVRRNRAASIAAAAIALSIVGAGAFMAWSYRAEQLARRDAETRGLIAEAGRLDQLGHRPYAFALLRAAQSIGGPAIEPDLARGGFSAHTDEPQAMVLAGHDGPVTFATLSPDGTRAATATVDGVIGEWDPATGALLRTLSLPARGRHRARIYALAYSPDGTHLAAADNHRRATLWDLERGAIVRAFRHPHVVEALAFSPDGRLLATLAQDHVARVFPIDGGPARVVARLGDATARTGNARRGGAVAFAPDGARLAVAGGDGGARVVNLDGSAELALAARPSPIHALDWSADGARVAAIHGDGHVEVWAASGPGERAFVAHRAPGPAVRFDPSGDRLVTASEDGAARVWSARSGALLFDLTHRGRVLSATFGPGGRSVLTSEFEGRVAVRWSLPERGGLRLRGHGAWVHDVAFSPDGRRLASSSRDGTVRIWETARGVERRVLRGHEGSVYAAAFSPDGAQLASVARDGRVIVWDSARGGAIRTIEAHADAIYDLAWIDRERIATASLDRSVRVFRVADGERTFVHAGAAMFSLGARDGWLAAGDENGAVLLFRMDALGEPARLEGHQGQVNAVDLAPGGALLASGGVDGSVLLWEPATGRLVRTLVELEHGIIDLSFSPDGAQLVTASEDATARVWDVATGHLVGTYEGHSDQVRSAAFSPDGRRIATGSADQTVRLWRTRARTPSAAELGARTNLRACRDGFTVVPVVLGPGIDPVWAGDDACALAAP